MIPARSFPFATHLDLLSSPTEGLAVDPDDKPGTRMPRITESHLVRQILDGLRADGWMAWRNNSGAAMLPGRGGRLQPVRFGERGAADILALRAGIFLAVEVKRPGRKPTEAQQHWLGEVAMHGGIPLVATCYQDVEAALEDLHERKIV